MQLSPPEREATRRRSTVIVGREHSLQAPSNMWFFLVAVASQGAGLALPSPSPPAPPIPLGAQCLSTACYSLFWTASGFAEAQSLCEAGGGYLMTVRSTVAAEAIALLLRDRPGSAWLGLRLPENVCVQPSKRLRGFQWVTGDERTDYEAWASNATDAAGPTCDSRCVVVSRQLKWQERACDQSAEGLFCEYSYASGTCGPLLLPPAVAVSYLTPFGARESDLVALPPGTTAEVPSLGTSLECRAQSSTGSFEWGSAAPGAWNCQLKNGGCDGQCHFDDQGKPYCSCPEGGTLLEDKRSCWSPCASLGCQQHCVPQGDSGVCMCFEGYMLDSDGRSCVDIDDCRATPGPCEQECVNTEGAFECRCRQGYEMVNGKCLPEKWQCFDLICEHDCSLVDGEYKCTCSEGYIPDPQQSHKCLRVCNQTECPAQCDPHTEEACFCPEGFILDVKADETKVCTDIDECESGYCNHVLKCINSPGSYHCICHDGLVQTTNICEQPSEEPEEEFSGDTEKTSVPPSSAPPKDGSSRGTLVAIIVSVTFMVAVLAVVLCYLVKKHYTARSLMDYKCQQSESGVALQYVSPSHASSRQKM